MILNEKLLDKYVFDIKVGVQHCGCITKDGDHEYYIWGCNCYHECCNESDERKCFIPRSANEHYLGIGIFFR